MIDVDSHLHYLIWSFNFVGGTGSRHHYNFLSAAGSSGYSRSFLVFCNQCKNWNSKPPLESKCKVSNYIVNNLCSFCFINLFISCRFFDEILEVKSTYCDCAFHYYYTQFYIVLLEDNKFQSVMTTGENEFYYSHKVIPLQYICYYYWYCCYCLLSCYYNLQIIIFYFFSMKMTNSNTATSI